MSTPKAFLTSSCTCSTVPAFSRCHGSNRAPGQSKPGSAPPAHAGCGRCLGGAGVGAGHFVHAPRGDDERRLLLGGNACWHAALMNNLSITIQANKRPPRDFFKVSENYLRIRENGPFCENALSHPKSAASAQKPNHLTESLLENPARLGAQPCARASQIARPLPPDLSPGHLLFRSRFQLRSHPIDFCPGLIGMAFSGVLSLCLSRHCQPDSVYFNENDKPHIFFD